MGGAALWEASPSMREACSQATLPCMLAPLPPCVLPLGSDASCLHMPAEQPDHLEVLTMSGRLLRSVAQAHSLAAGAEDSLGHPPARATKQLHSRGSCRPVSCCAWLSSTPRLRASLCSATGRAASSAAGAVALPSSGGLPAGGAAVAAAAADAAGEDPGEAGDLQQGDSFSLHVY